MELIESFASETGHWYGKDGSPAYNIIGANGKVRPTTLRDARKLNLLPSVTTITRIMAAPGLDNWKLDQAIMSALTLSRLPEESDGAYIARIKQDAKEQAIKAAEQGTAIHGEIEKHYRGEPVDEPMALYVGGAIKAIRETFGECTWSTERSFASPLGYGGKTDLCTSEGLLIVVDVKSKDGDLEDVKCYDDHFMQTAAYAQGVYGSPAQCANLFVSRTHPGVAKLIKHTREEHDRGWEMFKTCLKLWQLQKGYSPC